MNLLTVGGSDPSSGAGIQGDIRTFAAHGAYGLTVITAVTSQSTSAFEGAESVSTGMLESQLDSVLSDFEVAGVKIGMVYTARAARTIASRLGKLGKSIPIVADPVIRSTTGGVLLRRSALGDYMRFIVPIAATVTPNVEEARALLSSGAAAAAAGGGLRGAGRRNGSYYEDCPDGLASGLVRAGAGSAIVTGVAGRGVISDVIAMRGRKGTHRLSGPVIPGVTHGGGCAFSASLLCGLAGGRPVLESARMARKFVTYHMKRPGRQGAGIGIIGAAGTGLVDGLSLELADAIDRFVRIRGIYRHIPECQTNFVYSKPGPRTIRDVLGVLGRITRAGGSVHAAGGIKYGGSKHVATALVAASKRFPLVRSAVNIRHDPETVQAMRGLGMGVLCYDRRLEPKETKSGGSSILWGVSESVRNASSAPDAICHDGDYGKEPMIVIFGTSPGDVLSKVRGILRYRSGVRDDPGGVVNEPDGRTPLRSEPPSPAASH